MFYMIIVVFIFRQKCIVKVWHVNSVEGQNEATNKKQIEYIWHQIS